MLLLHIYFNDISLHFVEKLLPLQINCKIEKEYEKFASDNNSSVHPRIMEALMKTNNGHALGYGDDPWTEEAAHKVKEQFSRPCEALFVFNGTGSNTMALQ